MEFKRLDSGKPTCLIYGHDGFDVDVLYNVRSLYRSLEFEVHFGKRIQPANLLVIIRPPNTQLNFSGFDSIHIYDYVGFDFPLLLAEIDCKTDLWIFCASEQRKQSLAEANPGIAHRIVFWLPPVDTSIWMSKIVEPQEYGLIHIGNYKPYYSHGHDEFSVTLTSMIEQGAVDVWGSGWEELGQSRTHHGSLRIRDVSKVYARAGQAVGMMYPHQRNQTLSGRFWHAPLNGCTIISEPSLYSGQIPGVQDWSCLSHIISPRTWTERVRLQESSRAYWDAKYQSQREFLQTVLLRDVYAEQPRRSIKTMSSRVQRLARLLKHRL